MKEPTEVEEFVDKWIDDLNSREAMVSDLKELIRNISPTDREVRKKFRELRGVSIKSIPAIVARSRTYQFAKWYQSRILDKINLNREL